MKKKLFYTWCITIIWLFPCFAFAGNVSLTWQANTDPDLAEYRVYYGTSSRVYGQPVPVGKVTKYTVTGLEEGKTYFFTVSAVDTSGNESGYSSEVKKNIPSLRAIPSPDDSSIGLITNLSVSSGKKYAIEEGLTEGAVSYIDRDNYAYKNVPDFLINASYIKTSVADSYQRQNDSLISFDINRDATVYIVMDDRHKVRPSWMNGFETQAMISSFYILKLGISSIQIVYDWLCYLL